MFIILPSDVQDKTWLATNTIASYQTTLSEPINRPPPLGRRACVYSVTYPCNWAYQGGSPPKQDVQFYVSVSIFDYRAVIGPRLDHVRRSNAGQDAIFAFVPEPPKPGQAGSYNCVKNYLVYHRLLPGPDIRTVSVTISDCLGRPVDFKSGTAVVTLHIE